MPTDENQDVNAGGNLVNNSEVNNIGEKNIGVTGNDITEKNIEIQDVKVENTAIENNKVVENDVVDIDLDLDGVDISVDDSQRATTIDDVVAYQDKNSESDDIVSLESLDIPEEKTSLPEKEKLGNVENNATSTDVLTTDKEGDISKQSNSDDGWLLEEDKKVEELENSMEVETEPLVDNDTKIIDDEKHDNDVIELEQLEPLESLEPLDGQEDLHVENLGETVVENKQGEVVSDTGDFNSQKGEYIPNEHDFNQVVDALGSIESGGQVELGSLEEKVDDSSNLDMGVGIDDGKNVGKDDGMLDLDNMIENFEASNTDVVGDHIHDMKDTTVVENVQVDSVVDKNIVNNPIETDISGIDTFNVENSSMLDHKNKHTGLKIFLSIIVLLVVGGILFSKMFPEEIGEIRDSISGLVGGEVTIVSSGEDMEVNMLPEESVDPDSLAGQLEGDNMSGTDITGDLVDVGVGDMTGENVDFTGDDFNAFEGFEEAIDSELSGNTVMLDQLYIYKDKGNEYDTWGSSINNTTAIKYGRYISKKSTDVINDIENGVEIDNLKVDNYFAQFDKYLVKLDDLRTSIELEMQNNDLTLSGVNAEATGQSDVSTGSV